MTKAWYEVEVYNDDDELMKVECLVDTYAEKDPYGTGDSPTLYVNNIIRAEHEGVTIELNDYQEEKAIDQVLQQLADEMIHGY